LDAPDGAVSRRVHRALEEVPEQQRTLISLTYWTGLSQSEIAIHLNLPLATVRARTREALNSLAKLLEGPAACSATSRRPTRFDSHAVTQTPRAASTSSTRATSRPRAASST
jgi:hypothetical protein